MASGPRLLSNVIRSQDELHAPFGGVVPEIAARAHLQTLIPVIERALETAGTRWEQVDGVAVTRGPGLVGCLLVGVNVAQPSSKRPNSVHRCSGWWCRAGTAT